MITRLTLLSILFLMVGCEPKEDERIVMLRNYNSKKLAFRAHTDMLGNSFKHYVLVNILNDGIDFIRIASQYVDSNKVDTPIGEIVFIKSLDGLNIFRNEIDNRLFLEKSHILSLWLDYDTVKRSYELANVEFKYAGQLLNLDLKQFSHHK